MRKQPPHAYFLIFFSLLALMSLPKFASESLRGASIEALTPAWRQLIAFKSFFSPSVNTAKETLPEDAEAMQQLRLENTRLQHEISELQEIMRREEKLIEELALNNESASSGETLSFVKKKHRTELKKLLHLQLEAVPAHVIFRSAASWNSSLWINVGETTNQTLGRQVVAKNSPVIIDTAVVGVVDFVGRNQSRVRLITDSGLTPSVRALRGSSQTLLTHKKINSLLHAIEEVKDSLTADPIHDELIAELIKARTSLTPSDYDWYLAKGELHGASKPLWRSQGNLLKGIGFNYDFADDEGEARDLRSGKLSDPLNTSKTMPILKARDLLVTTGMDGVFPPGLLVAEVKSVNYLKEGDYTYSLEATPVLGNLEDLSLVFVIPPVGFDSDEQPPPLGW